MSNLKYAPIKASSQYLCKYSGLSLEEKVIRDLHDDPKKTVRLLKSINGNSARTSVTKDQLYSKLLELIREGKVYRIAKKEGRKNRRARINEYKWFLESDFVVEQVVEEGAER